MIESRQTRDAMIERNQAADMWKGHLRDCIACQAARQWRQTALRCQYGKDLYAGLSAAERRLKAERKEDRKPHPDQTEIPL